MAAVGLAAQPEGASSAGNERKDSSGPSLYRWHWHLEACPRVPKIVCRSSQLAPLVGTTEIAGSLVAMCAIVPRTRVRRVSGASPPRGRGVE